LRPFLEGPWSCPGSLEPVPRACPQRQRRRQVRHHGSAAGTGRRVCLM
jgi:hypothetical protein